MLLAWACLSAPATPGAATIAAPVEAEDTARILGLINADRAAAGLGRLTAEPRLATAACIQARDNASSGALSHRGSNGSGLADRLRATGYPYASAAENLASGSRTAEETVRLWRESPGHHRNMMTADFTEAGVARQPSPSGDVWALVLAAPRPGAPAAGSMPPRSMQCS